MLGKPFSSSLLVGGFCSFLIVVVVPLALANDLCENAIDHSNQTLWTETVDTQGAAFSPPECSGYSNYYYCYYYPSYCYSSGNRWFTFIGNGNFITASTCSPDTYFDTTLEVITDSCDSPNCLTENDDDCTGDPFHSTVGFTSTMGERYWLRVFGYEMEEGIAALSVSNPPHQCTSATDYGTQQSWSVLVDTTDAPSSPVDCDSFLTHDAWFTIVANGGPVVVSTCSEDTEIYDTYLEVVDSCGSTLNCLAENDNAGSCAYSSLQSSAVVVVAAGTRLWIRITGFDTTDAGLVRVSVINNPPPTNEMCTSALDMGSAYAWSDVSLTTNLNADPLTVDCGSLNSYTGGDVWYTFVGNGGRVMLDTCNSQTDFDTVLQVYSGSCASPVCVSSIDDEPDSTCATAATLQFNTVNGTRYYVRVFGADTEGVFQLDTLNYPPPSNDLCGSAIDMSRTITWTADASTLGAVPNALVAPACDVDAEGISTYNSPDVWYSFIGNGGAALVSTCDSLTDFDTVIQVYYGSSCPPATCVDSSDDVGSSACPSRATASSVQFPTVDGRRYHIRVSGAYYYMGNARLTVINAPPLTNPMCANATDYGHTEQWSLVAFTQDAGGINEEGAVPNCPTAAISGFTAPDVWFKFSGNGGPVTVSTCNSGTNYDSALQVFTGSCAAKQCVVGNDDTNPLCGVANIYASALSFESVLNTTYYLRLFGTSADSGVASLSVVNPYPPANDECSAAIAFQQTPAWTVNASTLYADQDDAQGCGSAGPGRAPDVWYSLVGRGGVVALSTCSNGTSTPMDAKIQVFLGPCTELACIVGDDNSAVGCRATDARVSFTAARDTTYYIKVFGDGSTSGTTRLSVTNTNRTVAGAAVVATASTSTSATSALTTATSGGIPSTTTGAPNNGPTSATTVGGQSTSGTQATTSTSAAAASSTTSAQTTTLRPNATSAASTTSAVGEPVELALHITSRVTPYFLDDLLLAVLARHLNGSDITIDQIEVLALVSLVEDGEYALHVHVYGNSRRDARSTAREIERLLRDDEVLAELNAACGCTFEGAETVKSVATSLRLACATATLLMLCLLV